MSKEDDILLGENGREAITLLNSVKEVRLNEEKDILVYAVPEKLLVRIVRGDGASSPRIYVGSVLDALNALDIKASRSKSGVAVIGADNLITLAKLGVKFPKASEYRKRELV